MGSCQEIRGDTRVVRKTSETQEMRTEVSCCHLLMLGSLLLSGAQASPKERLKVKYKIKNSNNNGEHLEKQKINERLMVVEPEPVEELDLEAVSGFESLSSNSLLREGIDNNMFGLGEETLARVKSYRGLVTGLMGQLQRTARAQDLSVGDLVFDIVREVIAETLSGLFARGLGLHTARNGGGESFSFLNTAIQAVSKVASGKTSC